MTKQPIFLRISKDGKILEVKQFTGEQIVIGREGNVDALINDPSVSPIHAMIEDRGGTYAVCDLGSQGGTFVNGQKIVDHPLESGAEFQVGQVAIEFFIGVPRPKKTNSDNTVVTAIPSAAVTPTAPVATPTPSAPKPKPLVTPPASVIPKAPPKQEKPVEAKPKPHVSPPSAPPPVAAASAGVETYAQPTVSKPWPKQKATFAPVSTAKIGEVIKPSNGNIIEVILVWHDRVFATRHFENKAQVIQVGSGPDNQIVLPLFGSVRASHPLINISPAGTSILMTADMSGEVVRSNGVVSFEELKKRGSMAPSGSGTSYNLNQDEYVKVSLGEGVSAIIRFVSHAPDSKLLPFIDLSVNQLTGIIIGLMIVSIFMFYAYLYAPSLPDQTEEDQEPPRKAQFFYKKQENPVDMAEQTEKPTPKAAVTEKNKTPEASAQGEEGASQEPKHSNTANKVAQKKAATKNTANANPGSAAKVKPQKDVTKSGLLGAFATKGLQDQLNKAFQGSGNVSGLSKSATGSASDGQGSGVGGSALRDTGANGNGTATVGVAGLKTHGRGGGQSGYGTGTLGAKKNASLVAGDSEATFSPGIDKEAIRRVVLENLKQIKACYERGLTHNPGLYGKIVIKWTIGPGGRVLAASVKNTTMDSSEVENCAVSRLRTWKFPEPPAGEEAEVSYPFVFQAQE